MHPAHHFEALESRQLLSAATYRIVDLGLAAADAGFTSATVAGMDSAGHRIVGEGTSAQQANAPLVWTTRAHGVRRVSVLPTLGAGAAFPAAVNNAGQIVGKFHLTSDITSPTHACLWQLSRRGRYYVTDLGTFRNSPAAAFSQANAINSSGLIVGTVGGLASDLQVAATWSIRPSGRINATALQGNAFAATAVNDAGQIAGTGMGSPAMVEDAWL